jgi:hypothetical protein
MKRMIVFVLFIFAFSVAAWAQSTGGKPIGITEQILASILGGTVLGVPLIGLSQLIKTGIIKLLKLAEPIKPIVGYVSSYVACGALAVATLGTAGILNVQNFLIGSLLAWLIANGYYKRQNAAADKIAAAANGK